MPAASRPFFYVRRSGGEGVVHRFAFNDTEQGIGGAAFFGEALHDGGFVRGKGFFREYSVFSRGSFFQ